MDPRLIVVRDQFALRRLADDALARIAPTLQEARDRILAELEAAGDMDRMTWYITRRQDTLAVIDAQLQAVAERIEVIQPEANLIAFNQGMEGAQAYLGAVTPPDHGPLKALAITPQQYLAVARGQGFRSLPGLLPDSDGMGEQSVAYRWAGMNAQKIRKELEAGFLLSKSTGEIIADVKGYLDGASGKRMGAQVEAIVRTSMATASQNAHDLFYAANDDVLGDKDANKYKWDSSNDGRLCPICAPLDDSKYKERNDVPQHPAHYNCRCVILPVTLISEELDPGQPSFLESVKAEKNSEGKYVAPKGYDGPNAYKRPRKIDGELRWVRRRDMAANKGTAGDMLQAASRTNEQTVRDVLGKKAEQFAAMTKKGAKYHGDPQQALIELLRPDGGIPNAASRRPPAQPRPRVAPRPAAAKAIGPRPRPAAGDEAAQTLALGRSFIRENAPGLMGSTSALGKARALNERLRKERSLFNRTTKMRGTEIVAAIQRNEKRIDALVLKQRFALQDLRAAMLKTPLSDEEQKQLFKGVRLYRFSAEGRKTVTNTVEEYIKMFNGQAFKPSANQPGGVSVLRQLGKVGKTGRGYMTPNTGVGKVPEDAYRAATTFHEITHVMEAQRPWMGKFARDWAHKRAYTVEQATASGMTIPRTARDIDGKPLMRLRDIVKGSRYKDIEVAFADKYMSPYMGKDYHDGVRELSPGQKHYGAMSEVWTMAVEKFTYRESMNELLDEHPDLFQMVVGISQKLD